MKFVRVLLALTLLTGIFAAAPVLLDPVEDDAPAVVQALAPEAAQAAPFHNTCTYGITHHHGTNILYIDKYIGGGKWRHTAVERWGPDRYWYFGVDSHPCRFGVKYQKLNLGWEPAH